MKIICLLDSWWNLVGWMLLSVSFSDAYIDDFGFGSRNRHPMTYKYDRIDEVKKECAFLLASASALEPDDNRMYGIKEELSFTNGDWRQGGDKAQLMPFDDRDVPNSSLAVKSPLSLVSFWVTDVDRSHRSKKSFSVSGILQIGLTRQGLFIQKPYEGSPHFDIWPGHSELSVSFQGIYTESSENGGERVMCLLGTTMLPARESQSPYPWEWVKVSGYTNQPPLLEDDKILLVLHFPKTLTLTNRVIQGRMTSLNSKSNQKYFDEVYISSWMGASTNYVFGSEKIVSKACDPYPYADNSSMRGIDPYRGLDLCSILERFSHGEAITISPNWGCNGTDEFCSKLGPFMSDKEIKSTDEGFKDVKLVMQDVRCKQQVLQDNVGFSRVSTVFRAVPPFDNQFTAAQRTGLNNMTLSAEGIWKSSIGQLCMVGCLGYVDAKGSSCGSRIILYIPRVFSVTQRSIIMGSISSIDQSATRSYFPLWFEKLVRPAELGDQYTAAHPFYRYSKIDLAGKVMEEHEPISFETVIKKSLLKFPKLEDTDAFIVSLSYLSEDLTLQTSAVLDPLPSSHPHRTGIELEIISIGPLFGQYWTSQNGTSPDEEAPFHGKAEYTETQLLLNVSAQLTLSGESNSSFSVIFLEGLYDQHVGKMYLIGCRDIRASWKILYESMDLEAGLDCLVEVVVTYPPTTARWLVNPTASISISSQRKKDDPLYFRPVKLQTHPIMYRKQREDILSRRGVEGILRIITLSVAIACMLSQLFYIRDTTDSVPYISLVMLGVQVLGYSLPLITGAEAIFKRMALESNENPSYDLQRSQWLLVIDNTVKLLVLLSFLVTLRLFQKVWKSRIRLLTRTPLEPHRVPSDKLVLFVTLIIHVIGYIVVLIIHSTKASKRPLQSEKFLDSAGNSQMLREWEIQLEEYMGLVQDWFLLPQIVGNLIWQINCRPLRKLYFVGITVVRVLPHVYDILRSPIPNPYFPEEYEFANPHLDFYTVFGDIAIPATAIFLAVISYAQQRWNYEQLSQRLTIGQHKLLPVGSKVYERLPSKAFEAELASGVNDNGAHEKVHDESDN